MQTNGCCVPSDIEARDSKGILGIPPLVVSLAASLYARLSLKFNFESAGLEANRNTEQVSSEAYP